MYVKRVVAQHVERDSTGKTKTKVENALAQ